jgi:hypothetical protein
MPNAHHTKNLERPPVEYDPMTPPVLAAPKMPLAWECVGCGNESAAPDKPCPKCGARNWERVPTPGASAALALVNMPAGGIEGRRFGAAAGKGVKGTAPRSAKPPIVDPGASLSVPQRQKPPSKGKRGIPAAMRAAIDRECKARLARGGRA